MNDMGFPSPLSPEHWSNGGTGVTNFQEHMRPVYVEAVKRHGDPELFVEEKSFGREPDYGGSLHCSSRKDLSDFWAIFNQVKAEMKVAL